MPKFTDKTNIVTAFGREVKIHPEYYYNGTKVAMRSEYSIVMIRVVVEGLIKISAANVMLGLSIMNTIGAEFSSKNLVITTIASTAFLSTATAAILYNSCESDKSLEMLAHEFQKNMCILHDDFIFTAEYALDYAADLLY